MAYTADDVVAWSRQFFPALRFSKGPGGENEAFYPVDAEGWLRHQADAAVVQQTGAATKHHRGSAIYRWNAPSLTAAADQWRSQFPVIAAGQVTLDAVPGTGIGGARFTGRPPADPNDPNSGPSEGDWYVDFAGWCDEVAKTSGSIGYTWQQYKTACYDTLLLPPSVRPTEPDPCAGANMAAPARFTPDATALHAYAEVGQLKDIILQLLGTPAFPAPLEDLNTGATALQGAAAELAEFVGITYYLLYPANLPSNQKVMEGDWEAISAFLDDPGGGGALNLRFAAYSQAYADGVYPKPESSCKAVADLEMVNGTHPVAYVGWGSHANYFTSRTDETKVTDPGINTTAVTVASVASGVAAVGVVLIVIGALSSPVGWALIIVGAALLIIAAIIALIAWALGAFDSPKGSASPPWDPFPPNETNPHTGDGPTSGGTNAGTPDTPPAAPVAGQPTPFLIHPVSIITGAVDKRCEPPSWWSYAGRWGVCVDDAAAMRPEASWRNGTWRRNPNGYTLTHRNAEALLDYLHGAIDPKTRTSMTFKPRG